MNMKAFQEKLMAWLQLARKHVWLALLALYPFADSILAWAETQLPVLQPVLGANAFRYLGLIIVAAKFALQMWRGWQAFGAMMRDRAGAD
jgi:hypothetical protein